MKNYYKILNLDFEATLAEVKKAYRRLALRYHPDKTDNELLKSRFAEIKEAYEVLRDPIRRRDYDRRFDNFSYRKDMPLTLGQVLDQLRAIRSRTSRMDPHRMDLDRLEFELTELLSEANMELLAGDADAGLKKMLVQEFMEAARPLATAPLKTLVERLLPVADPSTRADIQTWLKDQAWRNRWKDYKLVFALAAGIVLCLLIYFLGR